MTLTEFLNARLDEDEAVAREAVLMRDRTKFARGREPEVPDMSAWANDDVLGGAVVSVGPERVLAEVEAKRQIIAEHTCRCPDPDCGDCGACSGDHHADPTPAPCRTLRLLALPYAGHPDYDEGWRP